MWLEKCTTVQVLATPIPSISECHASATARQAEGLNLIIVRTGIADRKVSASAHC